jgi:beta-glucosidase
LQASLGHGVTILHEPGCSNQGEDAGDEAGIQRAVVAAQKADVAIVCIGNPLLHETEGGDRPNMELPGRQAELARRVAAVNPKTVVVLTAGAPVSMPWLAQVPALVHGLYTGQEGGNAVAAILLGEVNPSGKLTETLPVKLEDNPAYLNYPGGRDVRYGEGIFVGYRYYEKKGVEPLFPFGHGLSYTPFEYSDLKVESSGKIGAPVSVSLRVKNSGTRAGKEVVQLYVRDVQSSVLRPVKELKGFAKLALQPGESREAAFILDERAFAFYSPERHAWVVEPGEFEVLAGSSSRDIRLAAKLVLK